MIWIGSMPTCNQKSRSPPSTTLSPGASASSSSDSAASCVSCVASTSAATSSAPSGSSANSSATFSDSSASTSGVLMISSMAASTSSQLRPMTSAIEFQRLLPAFPVKCSSPPETVPRMGLPLKNFDTAASSHTDPMADTIANEAASAATDSAVGFSASSSSTTTRSN
ncbi:Uncharacterised protein [Mycobacterium tuberculosis]|nr:Uncharacterised protein [Mycobacterium tuberculosis]COX88469.1 Uncharacterised protein [Mycobacterium tuberculosis]